MGGPEPLPNMTSAGDSIHGELSRLRTADPNRSRSSCPSVLPGSQLLGPQRGPTPSLGQHLFPFLLSEAAMTLSWPLILILVNVIHDQSGLGSAARLSNP